MSRTLKTRTLTVRMDDAGPYIVRAGVIFRPDPFLLKETKDNRDTIAAFATAPGMEIARPGKALDYLPLEDGQKVIVSVDPATRSDSIGVFSVVDGSGAGTRALLPDGVPEGAGTYVTWNDELAPLRANLEPEAAPSGGFRP